MNPEQGFFLEGIEFLVKIQVILIFQFAGCLGPDRVGIVDDIINFNRFVFRFTIFIFAIWFRFCFGTKLYGYGQKLSVFVEDSLEPVFFEKFSLP